jgi:hypothetical protein
VSLLVGVTGSIVGCELFEHVRGCSGDCSVINIFKCPNVNTLRLERLGLKIAKERHRS